MLSDNYKIKQFHFFEENKYFWKLKIYEMGKRKTGKEESNYIKDKEGIVRS